MAFTSGFETGISTRSNWFCIFKHEAMKTTLMSHDLNKMNFLGTDKMHDFTSCRVHILKNYFTGSIDKKCLILDEMKMDLKVTCCVFQIAFILYQHNIKTVTCSTSLLTSTYGNNPACDKNITILQQTQSIESFCEVTCILSTGTAED